MHWYNKTFWNVNGLIVAVWYIFIVNGLFSPFLYIFDVFYIWNCIQVKYFDWFGTENSKYTQKDLNQLFEGYEI